MAVKDILKKCPFCGEPDRLGMGFMSLGINKMRAYFIICTICDAHGPWSVTKVEERDPYDTEKNTFTYTSEAMKIAMKKWNERARR